MNRLFLIGEDNKVMLNQEWIQLVPAFNALIKRDKGGKVKGDYRGDRKLQATKEFTFIFFDLDFTSPIKELDDYERREQALAYADLKESDLDDAVMTAHAEYNKLLLISARSLRTLRSLKKSLDALDKYYEEIDFTEVDKKGEMKHDMSKFLTSIPNVAKAYTAIDEFEKRVLAELAETDNVRGGHKLGGKEGKREQNWSEGGAPTPADDSLRVPQTNMRDLQLDLGEEE